MFLVQHPVLNSTWLGSDRQTNCVQCTPHNKFVWMLLHPFMIVQLCKITNRCIKRLLMRGQPIPVITIRLSGTHLLTETANHMGDISTANVVPHIMYCTMQSCRRDEVTHVLTFSTVGCLRKHPFSCTFWLRPWTAHKWQRTFYCNVWTCHKLQPLKWKIICSVAGWLPRCSNSKTVCT